MAVAALLLRSGPCSLTRVVGLTMSGRTALHSTDRGVAYVGNTSVNWVKSTIFRDPVIPVGGFVRTQAALGTNGKCIAEQYSQLKLPGGCHACFNAELKCYFAMTELPRQLAPYIREELCAASDGRGDLTYWC